jgi:hypothetical protein
VDETDSMLARLTRERDAALALCEGLREKAQLEADGAEAARAAMWRCCPRNAWGDGEHTKNCPHGMALARCERLEKALRDIKTNYDHEHHSNGQVPEGECDGAPGCRCCTAKASLAEVNGR